MRTIRVDVTCDDCGQMHDEKEVVNVIIDVNGKLYEKDLEIAEGGCLTTLLENARPYKKADPLESQHLSLSARPALGGSSQSEEYSSISLIALVFMSRPGLRERRL